MNLLPLKKRNFTLLEILIALSLTILLLSFLLASYFQAVQATIRGEKEEKELIELRYLSKRLTDVFANLVQVKEKKDLFFLSYLETELFLPQTPHLIFSYNNGSSLNQSLSGKVLACLYIDQNQQLNLLTCEEKAHWQEGITPNYHLEKLFSNVIHFDLEFFNMQDNKKEWEKNRWSKEEKDLPGSIKIILTDKAEKNLQFIFNLPDILNVIYFKS